MKSTNPEAGIRHLIDERSNAIDAKNMDALLSNHASDVLSFDVLNPLESRSVETIRSRAQRWFTSYQSAIGYEVRDLHITAGEDVAFCTYLYHVTGQQQSGDRVDMWVRATVCFQQRNGKWLIVHEHQSVPFDPTTGKASLDLKP